MAGVNSKGKMNITELDFDNIKSNLKTYLKAVEAIPHKRWIKFNITLSWDRMISEGPWIFPIFFCYKANT